jgi:hypothetical protein
VVFPDSQEHIGTMTLSAFSGTFFASIAIHDARLIN